MSTRDAGALPGFHIPGIKYIDIECTCCGKHVVELTGADAFVEVAEHECPEGALLHFRASAAGTFEESWAMRQTQWKRHE